jgi:hypothetical protein
MQKVAPARLCRGNFSRAEQSNSAGKVGKIKLFNSSSLVVKDALLYKSSKTGRFI